jgi:polysaccharide chain length determinant protein (PEP-CTERM system associated)
MANGSNIPLDRSVGDQLAELKRHFKTVWRAKLWILGIWAAVTLAAVAVAYVLPNVYRSSTMILVERQKVPEAYVKATVSDDMQELLKTISQQILSRSQIQQVIDEYGLADEPSTLELVSQRLNVAGFPVVRNLLDRYIAWQHPGGEHSASALVSDFKTRVKIRVVGRQAFSVAYDGHDPLTVMRVTNAMAGMFISENLRIRENRAEGTTQFLGIQLAEARRELEVMEALVQAFKTKNMGALPGQLDANLRALDRLQMEIQHLDETQATLAQQKSFTQRQLIAAERQLAEMSVDARAALRQEDPLAQQLAVLEARLIRLRTQYTDRFPEVASLKVQVAEIKANLAERDGDFGTTGGRSDLYQLPMMVDFRDQVSQIDRDSVALMAKGARLDLDFKDYQRRVESTPLVEQELQKLQRDYSIMQSNYQALLQKQMNARLAESLERRQKGEQFRVIDPANLPVVPISPRRKVIILLGLLSGLAMGIGGVIGLDMLRPRFHTSQDISTVLGLPVLAVIPQVKELEHGS